MANQIQSCFERYEKKYMLTPAQLRVMLTGMKAHMVPDQYGKYTICNIYYDTPDWRLIRASLEKPVYKEKLRVRSYGVAAPDGKVFVEIKKKFDGVVYKRRITAPGSTPGLCRYPGHSARRGAAGHYAGQRQPGHRRGHRRGLRPGALPLRPRHRREISGVFLSMALGLATGMGYVGLAVVAFVILAAALALLTAVNFGQRSESERVLKITIPESLDYDGLFDDLF